jgi:hypothetical protein
LNIADDTMSKYAAELVALAPDVMLASSSAAVAPLLEATRTVPIVFAGIGDPVAGGYVESQARPGGNATGFTVYEYSIGGKWLELLKEVAPRVTRIAVLRDSTVAAGPGQFGAVQALAPSVGVDSAPHRRARCQRDRARRHGVRGEPEWRRGRVRQSRSDDPSIVWPLRQCSLVPRLSVTQRWQGRGLQRGRWGARRMLRAASSYLYSASRSDAIANGELDASCVWLEP